MKPKLLLFYFSLSALISQGQVHQFKLTSSHTSFPDTGRANGHFYHDSLYTAAAHYSDSSVIVITPENFSPQKKVDLIFWFHGWSNNIDTALVEYGLRRQFAESGINAVLVLAETTKDAPDSFGGKLEQKNTFHELVNDVMKKLVSIHAIPPGSQAGNIVLAGHSGAYRVMAYILQNGNVPVQEVILFDALYAERDKFLSWLTENKEHRFIDLYTDHGGTLDESKEMMQNVKQLNISMDSLEEADLTPAKLQQNRVLFIHTLHQHNDIIQHPDNFALFLDNSPFLKKH